MDDPSSSIAARQLIRFIYRFPLPATKHVNLSVIFEKNMGNKETKKSIHRMDQARKDMATELASGSPNYRNVVAGATIYVPLIAQTLSSFEKSGKAIYLSQPLIFDWTTGIGVNPRTKWITNKAVIWDKVMSLAAQAIAQADQVHNIVGLLEGEDDSLYPTACMELRRAAGTFMYLAKVELPRWIGPTSLQERPLETDAAVCEALATFCLAEAQQMAIAKAISEGKASSTLLARLCLGVANQMDLCETMLRDKATKSYEKLNPHLLTHINFQSIFFRAMAYLYCGKQAWENDKYGLGIAYMQRANELVRMLPNPYNNTFLPSLRDFKAEVQHQLSSYEADNRSIYYEAVPSEVPDHPEAIVMMKPEAFAEVEGDALVFKNQDEKSDDDEKSDS